MVEVRVFGALVLEGPDGRVDRYPTARCRDVLAFLVLAGGEWVPRRWLIENVWPALAPESCANRLSVTLSMLRRKVQAEGLEPEDVFEADRHALRLSPGAVNEWATFWSLAAAVREGSTDEDREAASLALLTVHRAPLLVEVAHSWASVYRLEALTVCREAAEWLAAHYVATGKSGRAEVFAAMAASGQFGRPV